MGCVQCSTWRQTDVKTMTDNHNGTYVQSLSEHYIFLRNGDILKRDHIESSSLSLQRKVSPYDWLEFEQSNYLFKACQKSDLK